NTLTRKKEPFEPVKSGQVGIYLCGPTVYKPSHIGHAVGPIIFDAIKRYLVFRGFKVTWVVNITDVDDKLIIEAAKQGITTQALAERVTADYLAAMKKLHVTGIDLMPKASDHIGDIVDIIQRLIDKGCAYASGGDVYFDVAKDADYGKLSNRRVEEQEGQRDLQSGDKRNAGDFALWKAAKAEEPDEVKYDSPWGKGRPGWHIECSAMASRYLGETFDIHGGGMDLIFPHHENEIAQSESANDKPFAKYWLHNGLTRVNTKKVSKSDTSPEMVAALAKMTLHNLLAAQSGELIRFFVLSTHYRRPIEFSDEEIESKKKGLDTFYRLFERIERVCGQSAYAAASGFPPLRGGTQGGAESASRDREGAGLPPFQGGITGGTSLLASACGEYASMFTQAMDEDFNTAGAIAALFEFATATNRFIEESGLDGGTAKAASGTSKQDAITATGQLIALGRLIGLFIQPPQKPSAADDGTAGKAMSVLIKIRQHLRKKKDFETADLIRTLLTEQRITLEDRADGTTWRAD
ncbi:MAG: cysteine--tRNA ligase, partial [Planctomycetes bacterium]|nr:cysteine--tRNA ligase [Planctomycetota bacterium]